MKTVKTNDIKKGIRVRLHNGWYGTMADNARGNTRMVDVEGYYRETGSVYAHDIASADMPGSGWVPVEYTQKQYDLRDKLQAMGY
jgi:hypothetical protein